MEATPQDQHGPPAPDAAKPETRLKGHLGHLTKQEEAALTAFKEMCAKAGLYKLPTAESKASHDDGTMMYYPLRDRHEFVLTLSALAVVVI